MHVIEKPQLISALMFSAFAPIIPATVENGGMSPIKVRRSVLYVPGSSPAVFEKAVRSKADIVIVDLEDAVAPENKAAARLAVASALSNPNFAGRGIVVRVNGLGTQWCETDVKFLARAGATGLLFPKISSASDIRLATAMLGFYGAPRTTELWCMIETSKSILNAGEMSDCAGNGGRMSTWVLGTNDLVKELRAQHTPGREGLLPLLAIALAAARAGGLCVLDGVHNDVKDTDGFKFTCVQGRQMGFDGRTLIHPTQIEACNAIYSPSAKEVLDARSILRAFDLPENRGKGVIQLNGRMVELLHAEIARDTVAMAEAIGQITARQEETIADTLKTDPTIV